MVALCSRYFQWTGDLHDCREISFTDSRTTSKLSDKISEKVCQVLYYPSPFESVAVFVCEQVSPGNDVGRKAIMKVRTE